MHKILRNSKNLRFLNPSGVFCHGTKVSFCSQKWLYSTDIIKLFEFQIFRSCQSSTQSAVCFTSISLFFTLAFSISCMWRQCRKRWRLRIIRKSSIMAAAVYLGFVTFTGLLDPGYQATDTWLPRSPANSNNKKDTNKPIIITLAFNKSKMTAPYQCR